MFLKGYPLEAKTAPMKSGEEDVVEQIRSSCVF